METVDTLASTEALIGLILPPLLSVVIQKNWSASKQSLAALAACLIATVAVNAYQGTDLVAGLGQIVVATFVAYKAFWEPTGLADKIEAATYVGDGDE